MIGSSARALLLAVAVVAVAGPSALAQVNDQVPSADTSKAIVIKAPKTPKEAAPIDLTGNWVSVVTEDWRWRMLVPKKGDYASVPLSAEGRKIADTWDPSKLASDGCKAYGAAAIMRVPGRLQISWENDTTLRIDTDAGLNYSNPGGSKATITRRHPQRGHFIRVPRSAIGNARPRSKPA